MGLSMWKKVVVSLLECACGNALAFTFFIVLIGEEIMCTKHVPVSKCVDNFLCFDEMSVNQEVVITFNVRCEEDAGRGGRGAAGRWEDNFKVSREDGEIEA
jgi:hypothetical protein